MNPPDNKKTIEIARRTRSNLEFMDKQHRQGAEVYEFTQLFNSMLGMIVCVREEFYKGRPIKWSELPKQMKPSPQIRSKANTFNQLISKLRNAFAHSNFDFIADADGEITGVKVWNIRGSNRDWEETLTKAELREIAYMAIEYLEHCEAEQQSDKSAKFSE